jgi:hypothetical protein
MIGRGVHPAEVASGLSWTTNFGVACWFATIRAGLAAMQEARGGRPFVFSLTATADEIIALHQGRTVLTGSEHEALLEPAKLDRLAPAIVVEGTTTTVAELRPDSSAPAEAVGRWRQAAADYDAARCRPDR